MVCSSHEATHQIFQEDPAVLGRLLRGTGVGISPTWKIDSVPTDATTSIPLERRVDAVFKFENEKGKTVIVPLEVQLARDNCKPSTWLYYVAYLQEKYQAPALLVIVCQNEAVARWAEKAMTFGPDFWTSATLRPVVLSSRNIPRISDLETAMQDVTLAALSVIVHAKDPEIDALLHVAAEAIERGLEGTQKYDLFELVECGLGKKPAAEKWSTILSMDTSMYRSQTAENLRGEGRAQQLAQNIVDILRLRDIDTTAEERERILACDVLTTLEARFARAVNATSVEDIFRDR